MREIIPYLVAKRVLTGKLLRTDVKIHQMLAANRRGLLRARHRPRVAHRCHRHLIVWWHARLSYAGSYRGVTRLIEVNAVWAGHQDIVGGTVITITADESQFSVTLFKMISRVKGVAQWCPAD